MADPGLPIAFAAGLVSFLSPCVLPVVPAYLSYMSGMGAAEASARRPVRTGSVAVAFVGGFSAVFVALGATATALGSLLASYRLEIARAGGALIIFMGLVFLGVIKVPWLYRERRFHPTPRAGLWGSALLGSAFAFGWSPCIGLTLGTALTMAAGRGSTGGVAEGTLLLVAYSLGLGLPFVAAGFGLGHIGGVLAWLRRRAAIINVASGALLVVVGLLFVTDQLFRISIWMQRVMTASGWDLWTF